MCVVSGGGNEHAEGNHGKQKSLIVYNVAEIHKTHNFSD